MNSDGFADAYKGRRALITGGAGFIGSHLAGRLIGLGAHVTLVDSLNPSYGGNLFNIADLRERAAFHQLDIRDVPAMEHLLEGQDHLFNLAAQTSHVGSMDDPVTDMEINVAGPLNMLEICRRRNNGIKVVFASTRQIYGVPDYLPVDEAHPVRPVDINGVSKQAAEGYHALYDSVFGVQSCVLRLTNTYGPGMRIRDARQTFVGVWIRNLIEGKPFAVFGDGLQLRDFNYVDDVVEAFLLAGSAPAARGRIYNVGGSEVVGLKELADILVALRPGASYNMLPFPAERKAIDIGSCYSSYDRIRNELGWSPAVSLRDGLTSCLNYYQKNFPAYVG